MKCEKYYDLLSGYIDDMLSDVEKIEIETHLQHCSSCQEELNILMTLTKELKALDLVQLPEDFHENLMTNINVINNKKRKYSFYKTWSSLVAVVAVTLVAILVPKTDLGFKLDKNINTPETREVAPINTRTFMNNVVDDRFILEVETKNYKAIKMQILNLLESNAIKEDIFQETISIDTDLKKLVIEFSINSDVEENIINEINNILEETKSNILGDKKLEIDDKTQKLTLVIVEIK